MFVTFVVQGHHIGVVFICLYCICVVYFCIELWECLVCGVLSSDVISVCDYVSDVLW